MTSFFNAAGPIAAAQKHLILTMVGLMLIIVIPTFIVLYMTAWKYRAGGKRNADRTNNDTERDSRRKHRPWAELILWAIPTTLIAVLATMNWQSAHALDPFSPIEATTSNGASIQPLTVQVVALPWKWLFMYPGQHIATVNWLEFPAGTPVHFELTADGPMSSFWIPQLGSQIYAMAAMQTQLNLLASTTGKFVGRDTEINGAGYAGMVFTADSVTPNDFAAWVASVQNATSSSNVPGAVGPLNSSTYAVLAAPSQFNPPAYYPSVDPDLYSNIIMQYMMPTSSAGEMMPGME